MKTWLARAGHTGGEQTSKPSSSLGTHAMKCFGGWILSFPITHQGKP